LNARFMRSFISALALTIAVVILVWRSAASGTPLIPEQSAGRLNVLLVTIDTLRADRLGSYGHQRASTPTLDALAASGVRFADATVHAPLTYPSHVAILTGQYQNAFGVRLNGMNPLPDAALTLAERFKSGGYHTGAVIGSVVVARGTGLAQGFDAYDDRIAVAPRAVVVLADLQRSASDVTAAAKTWLAARSGPWFLWVHYYDPHLPYSAPARFASAAAGRPYDAEISYVDAELGSLLKSVDRSRTAVVVTSDHGEALGDHGESDHGYFLYDATLSVPLIVSAPGVQPRVVTEQVRSIDIAPTLLDLAAVPAGEPAFDGESLRPLLDGRTRANVPLSLAESWYPRLHFGWSELRSARVGEWKYIAAPKAELYDLRSDRREQKNVINERPQVAGRLAAELRDLVAARKPAEAAPPTTPPDPATVERLRALGYVGTFAPVTSGSANEDPKDRVADYRSYRELFNRALGLLGRNQAEEGAALLRRLIKLNVRAFEAHLYLGNAYSMLGRQDAALAEYDVASQLNPTLATPHFEAAKVFSARGDTASAVRRARAGLALASGSAYGHYTLGIIHRRARQWPEAFAALQRAVELNEADPRARSSLASTAMHLKDYDTAQTQYEALVELQHEVAPAHYNLGLLAAARGDQAEAKRRYQLALKADPAFKPAQDALARLK
jgi:arylsulfatase A-like enzyme/Tfp pilus assembly protein PilF